MMVLGRIVFGALLIFLVREAQRQGTSGSETGFLLHAGYLAICLLVGIINAALWAPFFGEHLSQPLTVMLTDDVPAEAKSRVLRLVHWLEARHYRRAALCVCFLEGIHRPDLPAAFVAGLKNARPGSRLERVFAREVYRFNNVQHCVWAYQILKRHGVHPPAHRETQVQLMILAQDREQRPEPALVVLPERGAAPVIKRDARIQLFPGARTREDLAAAAPGSPQVDKGQIQPS